MIRSVMQREPQRGWEQRKRWEQGRERGRERRTGIGTEKEGVWVKREIHTHTHLHTH